MRNTEKANALDIPLINMAALRKHFSTADAINIIFLLFFMLA